MADSEVRQKELMTLELKAMIRKIETFRTSLPDKLRIMQRFYDAVFSAGIRAREIARWIPVEEKWPQIGEKVLVLTSPGKCIHIVSLDQSQEWRDYCYQDRPDKYNFLRLHRVTHWQPLPAAPEEK